MSRGHILDREAVLGSVLRREPPDQQATHGAGNALQALRCGVLRAHEDAGDHAGEELPGQVEVGFQEGVLA